MDSSTPHHDRLIDRREAAELLGVKTQTLASWASTGRHGLPYLKFGRSVRYRLNDIHRWLEERGVRPQEGAETL